MPLPKQERSGAYSLRVSRFDSEAALADVVDTVAGNAETWHAQTPSQRLKLLQRLKARTLAACVCFGTANAKTKALVMPSGKPDGGTCGNATVMLGSVVMTHLSALVDTYKGVIDGSKQPAAPQVRTAAGGEAVCAVPTPANKCGKEAFPRVDMYIQPGKDASRGRHFERAHAAARGGVCVVLGAGNQPFLGLSDALNKMFLENYPVVLKHHDEQALPAEQVEYILQPLRALGCYAGLHCDVPLTIKMLNHPRVVSSHITGSVAAHDAICWGPKGEQEQRKAKNDPVLKVPMTSELGNVTPALVVPGAYSEEQLRLVAAGIAFNAGDNAGCNCLAPKVVVLASEWPQAGAFEKILKEELAKKQAPAWYPAAQANYDRFCNAHKAVETVGASGDDTRGGKPVLPWAIATVHLKSPKEAADVPGLSAEHFAPVLVVAHLSVADKLSAGDLAKLQGAADGNAADGEADAAALQGLAKATLEQGVAMLNDSVWGNLVATVYVDPATHAALADDVQAAVDALRYGSIAVNQSSFAGAMTPQALWGGYQGADTSMANARSGVGAAYNTLLFDHPQKAAVWYEMSSLAAQAQYAAPVPYLMAKPLVGALTGGVPGLLSAMKPF